MRKFLCGFLVIFVSFIFSTNLWASTLDSVLALYNTQSEDVDISSVQEALVSLTTEYNIVKNNYNRDMFLKAMREVALETFSDNNPGLESANVQSLERNRKYLHSLVDINADLDLIFEAESEYRNSLNAQQPQGFNKTFSLDNYKLTGTTLETVNEYITGINELQAQVSIAVVKPDIGVLMELNSPTEGSFELTSSYGNRIDPITGVGNQFHYGIDLSAPTGTNVLSLFSGKVLQAGDLGDGYGNCVLVSHSNEFQTFYAHLDEVYVNKGDYVTQYNTIGSVGSSGRSTGPHLHLGVYIDGKTVDPLKLFK